jgi:hypothetical protein
VNLPKVSKYETPLSPYVLMGLENKHNMQKLLLTNLNKNPTKNLIGSFVAFFVDLIFCHNTYIVADSNVEYNLIFCNQIFEAFSRNLNFLKMDLDKSRIRTSFL